MREENLVVFKGTAEGIIVLLDELADFDAVLKTFRSKLNESKAFFKGSKVSIRFKGRKLDVKEQEQLIEVLTHQEAVNISFVHQFEEEATDITQELLWIKEQLANFEGSMTHFHYGILRSGQHVEYRGNVVILGDVNPGAIVSAGGHVIVLGALKGTVHAGLDCRIEHPFVVCTALKPIQIGIKNIIAQAPNDEKDLELTMSNLQIAYLHDNQIYVDQIDSKTLNHMLK